MNTKDTNPKDAIGSSKPALSVIPCPVLFEVGAAMTEGAAKYRRHNYRIAGVRHSIYYDAAMRHLMAFWEGEDIDPDSGIHHISKAIAGLVVLRDSMMQGNDQDDRPPVSKAGWMQSMQEMLLDVLERYPNPLPPFTERGPEVGEIRDDEFCAANEAEQQVEAVPSVEKECAALVGKRVRVLLDADNVVAVGRCGTVLRVSDGRQMVLVDIDAGDEVAQGNQYLMEVHELEVI